MKITAVIMCSGLSRRMGTNKLFICLNNKMMYEHIIDTVLASGFDKIVIVTSYREIAEKYSNLNIIINNNNTEGISASIRLGVENSGSCDGIMFFTADQPFIDAETIKKLVGAFENDNKIIVPICKGTPKSPVIFPIRYKNELMALHGDEGGKKVYKKFYSDVLEMKFNEELPFLDIDTKDDLARLKKINI